MYKRVLIKLSGEALASKNGHGIDPHVIDNITSQIIHVYKSGIEIAIVVGGGNFWRGRQGQQMDRVTADHMGMLATIMNSLALQDSIESKGVSVRVQSALSIPSVAEPVVLRKAKEHFVSKHIVIFACGTGHPYFSTDTGAALRAAEMGVDVLLMAKNIDGVYDSDPRKNTNAKKYDEISYLDIINQKLELMDTTAITLCMENNIKIVTFGLDIQDSIIKAAQGAKIGTLIS
ncbi:MAG: UMP kinase [Clostridiales bacterium]|nr:UMP kinase [Clostridiales bacterium]